MRSFFPRLVLGTLIVGILPIAAQAATTSFGPTAYLQYGDTPADFACAQCELKIEDFEDNMLDPFISIDNGMIIPPNYVSGGGVPLTDSVDGDDGSVDGNGNAGYSWFTGSKRNVTVTFASVVKSAGLVFTDGDDKSTNFTLEAFDTGGNSLGLINAGDLADDNFTGETAEDRFLGFQDMNASISYITLTMDAGSGIEIDHIHYQDAASCVPEPGSLSLVLIGMLGLCGLRRRRG